MPSSDEEVRQRDSAAAPDATGDPYRRTFVGREAELRRLRAAFDAAAAADGGVAMVVGEPGIGKTALWQQLADHVAARGGQTLVGHSYEEGSLSLPYLAFVEALRAYVLDRDPDSLRAELGSGAADLARIVPGIRERLGVEVPPAQDAEGDRWRLLLAVGDFLRNVAAAQPLLLVLEDLHWADRGTLDLLQHVARNLAGARLLIVGTYRGSEVDRAHALSGVLSELRRGTSFCQVSLRGLSVDEVQRMFTALHEGGLPRSVTETVYRQTEANPLFVQEVLRYLVEEELASQAGGPRRFLMPCATSSSGASSTSAPSATCSWRAAP